MSTTTTLFGSTEAQAARDLIGGTAIGDLRNDLLKQILVATANRTGGSGSSGTVTSFSFTNGAGISGVVTNPTTTPALALTLGAITPTSVNGLTLVAAATGFTIAGGTTSKTLTVQNTLSLAGVDSSVLTIPATGTAALLGTANVFTAAQTVTQGTANAGILASTGYSLTGSDTTSMIDLAGTWNTTGAPTAIKLNITRTAAAATSLLMDLQQGGVSAFNVLSNSAGNTKISFGLRGTNIDTTDDYGTRFTGYFGNIIQQNTAGITCVGVDKFSVGINADLLLCRKAAATLQLGVDAAGVTNQMFTAASRITSDGVGANLTIAGGNGRGGAGGSLIFSTYTTAAAAIIGTLTTRLTLDTNGLLTFADAVDMAFNTTTGTKIGTAATQKLGFWNATPVVQPATGGAGSSFSVNAGTPVLEDSTWDGYTISIVIAALRNIGILA